MPDMNMAAVLKSEIVRLARKELRNETQALKKAAGHHRSEIAALKRRVQELERQVRRQGKAFKAPDRDHEIEAVGTTKLRFSAKGLAAQRKRLGLSAHDVGLLVGASGQSVYNWESGQIRPRDAQLPAIAALREMGRREASARLEALREEA
jgi:DNA-binding transcriptional regulator YiaG